MVATGVADRARARIAQLIYLDAFAPNDGDSVLDLLPPAERARSGRPAATAGAFRRGRCRPTLRRRTSPGARRAGMPQPAKTFEQKLRLHNGPLTLPRHYIYCTRHPPDDRFRPFYERAKREGWGAYEIDASHNPHITCPEVLADLLDRIAR